MCVCLLMRTPVIWTGAHLNGLMLTCYLRKHPVFNKVTFPGATVWNFNVFLEDTVQLIALREGLEIGAEPVTESVL